MACDTSSPYLLMCIKCSNILNGLCPVQELWLPARSRQQLHLRQQDHPWSRVSQRNCLNLKLSMMLCQKRLTLQFISLPFSDVTSSLAVVTGASVFTWVTEKQAANFRSSFGCLLFVEQLSWHILKNKSVRKKVHIFFCAFNVDV